MTFPHPLQRTFRYLELIFITANFSVGFNSPEYNLPAALSFYSIFFLMSWLYPSDRSYWQRCCYIFVGISLTILARRLGVDVGLFLFFYISKSYFLLHHRATIFITILTGVLWTISEYIAEVDLFNSADRLQKIMNPIYPLKLIFLTLIIYTAASVFVIMFSSMVVEEQKSRQRADELAIQVESLAATLERTRIAREIHDSLGHTLTDLNMQLAVAQQLRSHNLDQAFQAIDVAKVLAHQCIEDVSHALDRMRQSDFDLNQALIALMEQMRHNSALQVKWEINLPHLPVHQSYQIYCIVKEGMINVQKHAQATQVNFYTELTSQGLVLELKDDGIGFDPEQQQSGFGIQGMMERVQLLGGKFKLNTTSGQGTQIQVILPL